MIRAIRQCLRADDKLLVVHSSLPNLHPQTNRLKWDVLGAFKDLVETGITVVAPAFTFSFCQGTPFHFRSPSETGIIADWMLGLVGAVRTPHPIYSFVAVGPLASRLAECHNSMTFGNDSTFAFFEEFDASILMLGSEWKYCTQFHRYEEEARVAYRTYKEFAGLANFGSGSLDVAVRMFVRDSVINAENDWSRLESAMRSEGMVRTAPLWQGVVEAAACRDIGRLARRQLQSDQFAMVHEASVVEYACAQARSRADSPPIKMALLGSSNLEILKSHLETAATELIRNQSIEIYTVPYGQMHLEISDPGSGLYKFNADFTVFCDRLEDLVGVPHIDQCAQEVLIDRVRQYSASVADYRAKSKGWIFVNKFVNVWQTLSGKQYEELTAVSATANTELVSSLEGVDSVHFVDVSAAVGSHQVTSFHDPRLWFLGRIPYSNDVSIRLARYYTGLILAATGRTARILALDLDNTLWGGVLGEDGLAGIAVGGDHPGNAFAAFQRGLKMISERGVALVLLSKNDEDLALAALSSLPAMILKKEDFVARRINWEPKSRNIRDICQELSLGLENVLFIDDNPIERDQMRRNQPAVKVHDLPGDPSLYLQSLIDSPWLASLTVTAEDKKRVVSYRQRATFLQAKSQRGANAEDFYASLGTTLFLQPFAPENASRALQLLQKTNQFNTTTRRHRLAELEEFIAQGDDVIVIGLHDRYSEFENIGLLICRWNQPRQKWARVDTYLLSCRVLGRGIETGILQWLISHARARGMHAIVGELIETPRNTPVRGVFADAGFLADKEHADFWVFDLDSQTEVQPPWLTFVNGGPEAMAGS